MSMTRSSQTEALGKYVSQEAGECLFNESYMVEIEFDVQWVKITPEVF